MEVIGEGGIKVVFGRIEGMKLKSGEFELEEGSLVKQMQNEEKRRKKAQIKKKIILDFWSARWEMDSCARNMRIKHQDSFKSSIHR